MTAVHHPEADWARARLPKASTVLANELRSWIVRARLDEGAPFPSEAQIIERSGFSRATVREALRLIEAEGLIVTRRGPGGGVRVGRPDLAATTQSIAVLLAMSEATMGDMFVFRRLVEKEAAFLAAKHATPEQILALREHVSELRSPVADVVNFHDLIADATGNEFFRVILKIVVALAGWHTPDEGLSEHDLQLAQAAHAKVVARIADGDAEGAAQAMDVHLSAFEELVRARGNIDQQVIRASDWS